MGHNYCFDGYCVMRLALFEHLLHDLRFAASNPQYPDKNDSRLSQK